MYSQGTSACFTLKHEQCIINIETKHREGAKQMETNAHVIAYIIELDAYIDRCYNELNAMLKMPIGDYFKTVHFKSRVSATYRPHFVVANTRYLRVEYAILDAYIKGVKSVDPTKNKTVDAIALEAQQLFIKQNITF